MRLALVFLFLCCASILGTNALPQGGFWDRVKGAVSFTREAAQGTKDMARAYTDMREANFKHSDKYFHARGNHDAAKRGPGGRFAARVISDAREAIQGAFGSHAEDTAADQEANRWGRRGGDPNKYRPRGLPEKY